MAGKGFLEDLLDRLENFIYMGLSDRELLKGGYTLMDEEVLILIRELRELKLFHDTVMMMVDK